MLLHVTIQRFNPEQDARPRQAAYQVQVAPTDSVLTVLHEIRWRHDGTLAFRRSCAHGVCGSDAMLINGRNRLACKVLVKQLKQPIMIAPMRGFPVVKDLIVNMEPFFEQYRRVKPFLMNASPPPDKERLQSPKARERFDDTTKCILCGACTTACPSFWADAAYIGPATLVQAHRFIFDSRDQGAAERLHLVNEPSGVWRCHTIFNCVEACPRAIDITKAIADVKKAIIRNDE